MPNEKFYERFPRAQRLEHWLLVFSFTTLAVTGLPQKFPGDAWAETLIAGMGGIEMVRVIHHLAAIMLLLESVYHGVVVAYKMFVTRVRWTMFPQLQDAVDALNTVLYNLGMRRTPPPFDRYSFAEKAEYWALVWGTVIMALTGFMLWNPIITSRFLPGDAIPAAKAAHGAEAILAALAIVVWHFYHVHLKTLNRAMFTGNLSAPEMREEHPVELARIQAGASEPTPAPALIAQRRRGFIPIATVVSIVLLLGVFLFITAETTAVTTVPKPSAKVQVFAPRTATATRAPTRVATPRPGETAAAQPTQKPSTGLAPLPVSHAGRAVCQVCHVTGVGSAPKNPADHAGRLDASCTDCHKPK